MSKLRNKTTGDVISTSQFKGLYPNTSFPKPMTVEVYEAFGYDSVLNGPAAAEVTNTDYIDPLTTGFTITSSAPDAVNASGGTYIYLAIA